MVIQTVKTAFLLSDLFLLHNVIISIRSIIDLENASVVFQRFVTRGSKTKNIFNFDVSLCSLKSGAHLGLKKCNSNFARIARSISKRKKKWNIKSKRGQKEKCA